MKLTKNLAILLLAAGCKTPGRDLGQPPNRDMWVSDHLRAVQVEEAALVERVVYPHHFGAHSSRLSALGERHLMLLAADLSETPGQLAIPRGNADETLYAARRGAVRDRLLAAGLTEGDFTLAEAHPAGTGVSSDRLLEILAKDVGSTATNPLIPQTEAMLGDNR